MLIKNGHDLEQIKNYNLKQFQSFSFSVFKMAQAQALTDFTLHAIASQGDEKAMKKVQGELSPKMREQQNNDFMKKFGSK